MSQKDQILQHLRQGKTISPQEALNLYGCFRLAARIKDLRDEGHDIRERRSTGPGRKYSIYRLMQSGSDTLFDMPSLGRPA